MVFSAAVVEHMECETVVIGMDAVAVKDKYVEILHWLCVIISDFATLCCLPWLQP